MFRALTNYTCMPSNTSPDPLRPSLMSVAVDHHQLFKLPEWKRRSRLRSSIPLPNPSLLLEQLDPPLMKPTPTFYRSLSTPCLSSRSAATSPAAATTKADDIYRIVEIVGACRSRGIQALIVEAAIAMAFGAQPVPISAELNKAYCLHDRSGESFAVLKPVDEELLPLGFLNRPGSSTLSVRAGETGVREVAAYLLDHGGFSGVPPTALVRISSTTSFNTQPTKKLVSIQRFVSHDFDAGELGPSRFSVSSVHRIGILDLRILNVDRHAGNILVKKQMKEYLDPRINNDSSMDLVPIDHGLCLPELLDDPYFEWLHWPQASVPFSELEADYVAALDPFQDAELLRSELPTIRESSLRTLIFCTIFLKRAVSAGLCLAEIGNMMTREFSSFDEGPSALEIICKQTEISMNIKNNVLEVQYQSIMKGNIEPKDDQSCQFDHMDHIINEEEVDHDRHEIPDNDDDNNNNINNNNVLLDFLMPQPPRTRSVEELNDLKEDERSLSGLIKSVSFSAADFNLDGRKNISFEEMSEEEWRLFLETFEQILPAAFEARRSLGLKQRYTSCRF